MRTVTDIFNEPHQCVTNVLHELVDPSIVIWPLHHADGPRRVERCAGEETLGEGQGARHHPDDCNHYLCGCGGQPGLQWMNDGHVSMEDTQASLNKMNGSACIAEGRGC